MANLRSLQGRFRREHPIGASAREPAARTRLPLAGSLQRQVDCGQGVRGMDNRDGAQAEGVGHEAGKEIGAHLAFARARLRLDNPEQTGRYARTAFRVFSRARGIALRSQLDLNGQGLGHAIQGAFVRLSSHAAKHRGWT